MQRALLYVVTHGWHLIVMVDTPHATFLLLLKLGTFVTVDTPERPACSERCLTLLHTVGTTVDTPECTACHIH